MTTPKSLRPRYRYIFVRMEHHPTRDISMDEFGKEIWFEAQNLVGDVGSAETDIELLDTEEDIAIIKCRRGEVDRARSIVCCLDSIGDISIGFRVIGVSGTIKSGREKFIDENTMRYSEIDTELGMGWVKDGLIDIPDEDRDTNFIGYTANELNQGNNR